jgi:DNA (cytosine-5)-methyltransferase 1
VARLTALQADDDSDSEPAGGARGGRRGGGARGGRRGGGAGGGRDAPAARQLPQRRSGRAAAARDDSGSDGDAADDEDEPVDLVSSEQDKTVDSDDDAFMDNAPRGGAAGGSNRRPGRAAAAAAAAPAPAPAAGRRATRGAAAPPPPPHADSPSPSRSPSPPPAARRGSKRAAPPPAADTTPAATPTAAAKPAPKRARKGGPMATHAGDTEHTFDNVDATLWDSPPVTPPSPLPSALNVLELFAGCGGFHLEGGVSFGAGAGVGPLSMKTLVAVEIEDDPARTYKHNHASVNVLQMGVGRFLGTARRLLALKNGTLPPPPSDAAACSPGAAAAGKLVVSDMRVDVGAATRVGADGGINKRTTARQDKDSMTLEAARGERPLSWLVFRVHRERSGAEVSWERDADTPEMRAACHAYLNDTRATGPGAFGPHKFPLPGDIQVVTGGPPCQGWSGYNTTRITAEDLQTLMTHKENRLLGRFLEVVWFYQPLFVVMEEVPDVARKPEVMTWMGMVLDKKGYSMTWDKKVTTGLYGCPQTRDRLIVIAAMKALSMPERPRPITARHDRSSSDVQWAYDESDAAYPITMRCATDGSVAKATAARRIAADAQLAKIEAQLAAAAAGGASGSAPPPAPRELSDAERVAAERKAAIAARGEAKKAATAAKKTDAAGDASLLRALVLGDSLSCDLPLEPARLTGGDSQRTAAECVRHQYVTAPPTPYIAYLCRDMPTSAAVENHSIFLLGLSDEIRVAAVPFRDEACWRDMMGPSGTMHAPQMVELTREQFEKAKLGDRWRNAIPDFMLAGGKPSGREYAPGELPALAHGYTLAPNRFPMCPYWCTTMKRGKDRACYGRLSPTEPHDTVHSYSKPHWHVSLTPFAPRCLSVRDKARVQGFPDSFVFRGNIQAQYKQIANAVSPQLAKAIGRQLLLACARSLAAAAGGAVALSFAGTAAAPPPAPLFTRPLQNFAEFLESFDEASLPKLARLKPTPLPSVTLSPCTYEEMLVAYNTQARFDHSTRYKTLAPFEVLDMVEDQHCWKVDELVGIRRAADGSVQVAGRYPGFPFPEWTDVKLHADVKLNAKTWAMEVFMFRYGVRAREVHSGARPHFCLPGVDPAADAPPNATLDAARARNLEMLARYKEEVAKGWVHASAPRAKAKAGGRGGRGKKKAALDSDDSDPDIDPEEAEAAAAAGEDLDGGGDEEEEEEGGGAGGASGSGGAGGSEGAADEMED